MATDSHSDGRKAMLLVSILSEKRSVVHSVWEEPGDLDYSFATISWFDERRGEGGPICAESTERFDCC